ncbi:glycogen debranching protein GlgX [Devosia sp. 63-57]|uniref:glycogen debranching protein GlgX n=1 Tax=Devosia sp. 63-57 TaxID=1895751 RepID=UPI00086D305B|nr:glycogen debranching protein GlgX [Devosia sp. 63-57]ODT50574.1 MAG: glycogen debranching enzyme GlgX [Pelagibacterium sp. SCN 63-126]ODU88655.1 MAG: glycogen debranching enzyme GlgX [Pelagibacterium sp. SCN 63-17]OJX45477.1 MAG: glycogen debranching enzyme GlgX [Devosia sp. 63-57]
MKPELVPHAGRTDTLGATVTPEGINFAVYSESATALWVCIFDDLDQEIGRFELDVHEDHIHAGLVANVGPGTRYGLRADGPYDPDQGFFFDPNKLLVDPYARHLDRVFVRSPRLRLGREEAVDTAPLVPKAIVPGAANEPILPRKKAPGLFYEVNVRGFTMRHPSVQGPLRGTIAGMTTKWVVDHFKHLGVDTVQLMPTAAWIDEGHLPALGLTNAWGYNPVAYFAVDPRLAPRGPQELRVMTDTYRKAGISVILDVVYNHTGEGDAQGPILSLMGLDPQTYYRFVEVDGKKFLVNDTGTGNTLRGDHPAVQRLVIDSLRYYVEELGVSGFRFDLATVLGRDPGFNPEAEMLKKIKADPVLSKAILVAEPWDPGPGGYALGKFGQEFQEHNDTYRDEIRAFWKGEPAKIGALAGKVAGSAEIFDVAGRKPSHGVNMLAVHDGFTLRDLVSYNDKHNDANGENNRDGHNHNSSWNCGVEGETDDEGINAARKRDVRAMLATLFLSRGTPLIQQGDELYRTQQGNNNAYAQDNEITWVDWDNADGDLVNFVAALNVFRHEHTALIHDHFLSGQDRNGVRDVVWLHPDGREMNEGDWNDASASVLGMLLHHKDDEVLVWFNRRIEPVVARLPEGDWAVGIQSDPNAEIAFTEGTATLSSRSVVALVRPQP